MNFSVYICGSNVARQILKDDELSICCLISSLRTNYETFMPKLENLFSITESCIIKRNINNEWQSCGFHHEYVFRKLMQIKAFNHITRSENRLVHVNEENEVIVNTNECEDKRVVLQYTDDIVESDKESKKILGVAVNETTLLIVDEGGRLFDSGIQVPLTVKVKQICVGKEHCLALTCDGEILTWGSGMKGQLGDGELNVRENAHLVESLCGLNVIQISAGGWHSAAVTESGDVYLWGWNDTGQLGFYSKSLRTSIINFNDFFDAHECCCEKIVGSYNATQCSKNFRISTEFVRLERSETLISEQYKHLVAQARMSDNETMIHESPSPNEFVNVQTIPKLLEFWQIECRVKKVSCGDRHTLFLLEDGTAWSVGWNGLGQLGIGSTISKDRPQFIASNVVDIYASASNSVICLAKKG